MTKRWTFVGYYDDANDDEQVFVGYATGKTAREAASRLVHRLSGEAATWDAKAWAEKKGLRIVAVFAGHHENLLKGEMTVYAEDLF